MTTRNLRPDPPDRQDLSAAFGIAVPVAFVSLVQVVFRAARGNHEFFSSFWDDVFGLRPSRELWESVLKPGTPEPHWECRYPTTPPELVPIGDRGVDGAHVGFVVHAPELDREDYPVGYFCPMDGDGVMLAGCDTRHFVARRLSYLLGCWRDYATKTAEETARSSIIPIGQDATAIVDSLKKKYTEDEKRYATVVETMREALGVSARPDSECSWCDGYLPSPTVPQAWSYRCSDDRVGVLARKRFFAPGPVLEFEFRTEWRKCLNEARRSSTRGYAATALYYLREARWRSHGVDAQSLLAEEMALSYEALDRPLFARIVRELDARNREIESRLGEGSSAEADDR